MHMYIAYILIVSLGAPPAAHRRLTLPLAVLFTLGAGARARTRDACVPSTSDAIKDKPSIIHGEVARWLGWAGCVG
jgi:hypothetical protein